MGISINADLDLLGMCFDAAVVFVKNFYAYIEG